MRAQGGKASSPRKAEAIELTCQGVRIREQLGFRPMNSISARVGPRLAKTINFLKAISSRICREIIIDERGAKLTLFLFLLAYLAITYIYQRANTVPPKWDDSYYLANSEIMFKALQGNDEYSSMYYGVKNVNGLYFFTLFSQLMPARAPLISLVPLPAYLFFGTGFWGLTATYFLLIIGFSWVYYKLVAKVADSWTALLATVISSTMPLTVGLSRIFYVEYCLMILTIIWVFLQIKSDNFRDGRYSVPLGIVLGLGMLMKVTFPVYIIGPIFVGLISIPKIEKSKKQLLNILGHCFIVLLLGIAVMSIWYINNIISVLSNAFNAGFGNASNNYSLGSVFDVRTLLNYWINVINNGISFYYFVILVVFLLVEVIKHIIHIKKQAAPMVNTTERTRLLIIGSWFLIPFIIFSLGVNKDIRFLLPILPALGFIIARLIMNSLNQRRRRRIAIPLLLIFPFFLFGYTSLPLSATYIASLKPFLIVAPNIGYAYPPVNQIWEQLQILKWIEQDALKNNVKIDFPIGIIPNYEYFNPSNFIYFSINQNFPYQFEGFVSPAKDQTEWAAQRERLLQMDYLITKTGDQCPSFACNSDITPMLQQGELPFVEVAQFDLPDGSVGMVYRKK
jgi:hypothetical protein